MLDRPDAVALLAVFADFYRERVVPALPAGLAYEGRVALTVLDIVMRELRLGGEALQAEDGSLRALLPDCAGTVEELNRLLCERIADGSFKASNPRLVEHLWRTTLDKLAIDQPSYAAFRREAERTKGM